MTAVRNRRIVVGVDGSEGSAAALAWAMHQAELTQSSVEAVMTWEWPVSFGVAIALPDGFDPAVDAQRALEAAVAPARAARPDVTLEPVVLEGRAAPVLIEASRGADLLVVGSRGHGELTGSLIGSVSEHCATNAKCPVLVVRGPR